MDGGEGHFVAKFRRKGEATPTMLKKPMQCLSKQTLTAVEELFDSLFSKRPAGAVCQYGDRLMLSTAELPFSLPGVLRKGVPVGEWRGSRLHPAHGLFVAQLNLPFTSVLDLPLSDPRLHQFLSGEELDTDLLGKGFLPVLAEGWPVGFGKLSGGRLKNHYPKGLRRRG